MISWQGLIASSRHAAASPLPDSIRVEPARGIVSPAYPTRFQPPSSTTTWLLSLSTMDGHDCGVTWRDRSRSWAGTQQRRKSSSFTPTGTQRIHDVPLSLTL